MSNQSETQNLVKSKKLWKRYLFLILLIVINGIAFYFYSICFSKYNTDSEETFATVHIKSGTSFDMIAKRLAEKQIIRNPGHFKLAGYILGYTNHLKAGKYQIPFGLSNYDVLQILAQGKVAIERITIPEGKTHRHIASLLQTELDVDSSRFVQLIHDSLLIKSLGIDPPTLEGYLYPDTYYLTDGLSEEQIIRTLVNQFKKNFPDSIRDQDPELNLTQHQLVILASLIEGEAILDTERPLISALYRNRLKKGILLQCDATIQFLLPKPRRLLNRDLEIDSPYNTYMYPGLPPGPINNPGVKSLIAAAYPEDVDYLYMVARGDGGHTFSKTLHGHLNAKREFDAHRREVNRKLRQKN